VHADDSVGASTENAARKPATHVAGANAGVVLIVGQGLAGTALGLELESAGVDFRIVADAHEDAASRVAAGLINPVTGQRFVKSWRVDELLPVARETYARWERVLAVKLWHSVEICRALASTGDKADRARMKIENGELRPYVISHDRERVTISGGAWVDLPLLLAKARERWLAAGRLEVARLGSDSVGATRSVLCVGAGELVSHYFPLQPVTPVKGEVITVESATDSFDLKRVVQDEVWIRPDSRTRARVGATYEPGVSDTRCTDAAKHQLVEAVTRLAGAVRVVDQDAGVRLAARDRLPLAGWSGVDRRVGILGALGSKGALWAPWLASMWARHLADGSSLESVVSPQRFANGSSAVE
jgi:glycine oxidase